MTPHDTAALGALQERVRSAEGADASIDEAIMATFYVRKSRYIGTHYVGGGRAMSKVWVCPVTGKWVSTRAFEFTASIDRCVALIEKLLPGWHWEVGGDNTAMVRDPERDAFASADFVCWGGNVKSPALGLLDCLLQALIAIAEHKASHTETGGEHDRS